MPTTTNEYRQASCQRCWEDCSDEAVAPAIVPDELAWLEFPVAMVSCLLLPRFWFEDVQALVNGESIGVAADVGLGIFLVTNVFLALCQLVLLVRRL